MSAAPAGEPKIRRILVALDASPQSVEALRAAVRLARGLKAELCGIFVEDSDLLGLSALPFVREVRVFSARAQVLDPEELSRGLRALAVQARRQIEQEAREAGLAWSFRTVRGRVTHEILAAAEEADLITLGSGGVRGPAGRRLGSTARELLRRSRRPVLLMHRGDVMHEPVCIVHGKSPAARRALETARRIAGSLDGAMHVLAPPGAGGALALGAAVSARGAGLLVVAADETLLEGEGLQALFDGLRCALLLVR